MWFGSSHVHALCGCCGRLLPGIDDLIGSMGGSDQDEAAASYAAGLWISHALAQCHSLDPNAAAVQPQQEDKADSKGLPGMTIWR